MVRVIRDDLEDQRVVPPIKVALQVHGAAVDGGGVAVGGSQALSSVREIQAIRAGAAGDEIAQAVGLFGDVAKFGGVAVGVGAGSYQIYQGIRSGNDVSIAQGGNSLGIWLGTTFERSRGALLTEATSGRLSVGDHQ